ncbi:MAG: HAD family hydrolase [Candidatus Heimdallarchaeaceae archaeon]
MVTIQCGEKKFKDVKLIAFDKDGTLLDFNMYLPVMKKRAEVLIKEFALPQDTYNDLLSLMGVDPTTHSIIKGGPIHIQRIEIIKEVIEFLRNKNIKVSVGEIASIFDEVDDIVDFSTSIHPYPGVKEVLKKLDEIDEIKLVLLTLDSTKPAEKHLKRASIHSYFDLILGVDLESPYLPKPAPDMIQYACKVLDVDVTKSIIFGDDNKDMLLGKNAGILACIGVLTGKSSEKELQHADVIIDSVADIKIL